MGCIKEKIDQEAPWLRNSFLLKLFIDLKKMTGTIYLMAPDDDKLR